MKEAVIYMKQKIVFMQALVLAATLFTLNSVAHAQPASCKEMLMAEPTCVNKINAEAFCRMMNNDPRASHKASQCIVGLAGNAKPSKQIIAICLAGYVSSSRRADNKNLCDETHDWSNK